MIFPSIHGPGESLGTPKTDLLDLTISQVSPQDKESLLTLSMAREEAHNRALQQVTEVLALAYKGKAPVWVCHFLAQFALTNDLTKPEEFRKSPAFKLILLACETGTSFWNLQFSLASWHFRRQLALLPFLNPLRETPMEGHQEKFLKEATQFLRGLLDQLAALKGDQAFGFPKGEVAALFARIQQLYPPCPGVSSDHEVLANGLGLALEEATRQFEGSRWVFEALQCNVTEANSCAKHDLLWEADRISWRRVLDVAAEATAKTAAAAITKLCQDLSLRVHQDQLPTSLPPLQEVLADYKSLGYMNGWGESTPELLQKARDLFLPVKNIHSSDTGGQEVWACHHLKFFYRVDCS